jgi:Protein of unknown function (DUF1570)
MSVLWWAVIMGIAPRLAAEQMWLDVHSRHFDLYTTAQLKQVAPLLQRLEVARSLFAGNVISSTDASQSQGSRPLKIIAFETAAEYVPYQPKPGAAAFFQRAREADYIVLGGVSPEFGRIIVHEYTHAILHRALPGLPLWLQEGMADFYSSVELQERGNGGRFFRIGALLSERRWILGDRDNPTLNELFSVGHQSTEYANGTAGWHFYAESWAFAHFLALDGKYSGKLREFLAAVSSGTITIRAFEQIYGKELAQVESDFGEYWTRKKGTESLLPCPLETASDVATPLVVRAADPLETDPLLARVLAANPNAQYAAEQKLEALVAERPNETGVHEALAYILLRQNRVAEAETQLETSVQMGSQNADLIYRYALLAESHGAPDRKVLDLLERAIRIEPQNESIRRALASRQKDQRSFLGPSPD